MQKIDVNKLPKQNGMNTAEKTKERKTKIKIGDGGTKGDK
jgi:hypothetical protein